MRSCACQHVREAMGAVGVWGGQRHWPSCVATASMCAERACERPARGGLLWWASGGVAPAAVAHALGSPLVLPATSAGDILARLRAVSDVVLFVPSTSLHRLRSHLRFAYACCVCFPHSPRRSSRASRWTRP